MNNFLFSIRNIFWLHRTQIVHEKFKLKNEKKNVDNLKDWFHFLFFDKKITLPCNLLRSTYVNKVSLKNQNFPS